MIHYATRYSSPRSRPLTESEKVIRQTAYDLKIPTPTAIEVAAPLIAALLEHDPCWLTRFRRHPAARRLTWRYAAL